MKSSKTIKVFAAALLFSLLFLNAGAWSAETESSTIKPAAEKAMPLAPSEETGDGEQKEEPAAGQEKQGAGVQKQADKDNGGIPLVDQLAGKDKKPPQEKGPAVEKTYLCLTKSTWFSILALPLSALLAAFIAYHPARRRNLGVKQEERDVPRALILISSAGALISAVVSIEETMALALFGLGSFIRFRTPVKNPKETVVIFLCAGIGCMCGLHAFVLAIAITIFLFCLILLLERSTSSELERITIVCKGLGTYAQPALQSYKTNLEEAGIEVVSSKVSLKKGNVTILMEKERGMQTEDVEKIMFTGEDVHQPKSVEWVRQ